MKTWQVAVAIAGVVVMITFAYGAVWMGMSLG